ncbi:hypothetical protein BDF19DRAFT_418971 [Syncephalis fuscata]|nr:hypothetical protein BDF19DRAFT_418971 [Syncephalis fuscata]
MWPVTGMFPLLRVAYSSSYSSSSSSATSILQEEGERLLFVGVPTRMIFIDGLINTFEYYCFVRPTFTALFIIVGTMGGREEKILEQYQTATIKRISLPDGQVCEYQSGVTTPNTLLKNWNPKLSKQTVGAVFKGRLWDLNRPLIHDSYTNTSQYDQQNDEITF